MIVKQVVEALRLEVAAGEAALDREVQGGYVGDLLSCVLAGARPGSLWVTVQAHPNVVAVASLVGVSGVIVTEGGAIDPTTLMRAEQEGIPLLSSRHTSFEVVARLVDMGIRDS